MPPKKQAVEQSVVQSTASFADFNLRKELMDAIADNAFERPSDVQATAIPYCLERRDVRVQAKSGKGKTCVFVFSVLNMSEIAEGPNALQCLVLTNSHEMSTQVKGEFDRFAKHLPGFKCLNLQGKVPISTQIADLQKKDACVAVGTVGRIADLIRRGELDLSQLKFMVIDEADMLLTSEKSKEEIKLITSKRPEAVQTMVFSATFSEEAKAESKKILKDGFREVAVDDRQLVLHGLVQNFMEVTEKQKLDQVVALLKLKFSQAVIFTKSTERTTVLADYLHSLGIDSKRFVGRMLNQEREDLYRAFKQKMVRVIVCTDIFQRGVDFEGVNLVIHFDMPADCDSYLHRSGRAGRFETNGLVVSFVATEEDKKVLQEIQDRFVVKIEKAETVETLDVERAFLAK